MATIPEMESKMTVFYSEATAKIKMIAEGIQSLDVFGDDKADYNYKIIVADKDRYIIENMSKFNVVNGEIKILEEYKDNIQKYL